MNVGVLAFEKTGDAGSRILAKVAQHSGMTMLELASHRKARRYARPRQLAFVLCMRLTGWSYARIGKLFDRDHTTVAYGVRAYEAAMAEQPELGAVLNRLETQLRQEAVAERDRAQIRDALKPVLDQGCGIAVADFRRVADIAFEADPVGAYKAIYQALSPIARRKRSEQC